MVPPPHLFHIKAVVVEPASTAPFPHVNLRIHFLSNNDFLDFVEERKRLGKTRKLEEDFYAFHNHYWGRRLRHQEWARAPSETSFLPPGANPARPVLFTPLHDHDPTIVSTPPNFASRTEGYPEPRAFQSQSSSPRFRGKILRKSMLPTANFTGGYTVDDVVRDTAADQPMLDSTLVAFAEGIVPEAHITNIKYIATGNTGNDSNGRPLARIAIVFTTNDAYKACMDALVQKFGTSRPSRQPFTSWHNNFFSHIHSGAAPNSAFTPFLNRLSRS
ncbi:hypothetical protein JCM10908_001283 [Rhodotorula pacifica]|uniref:uncharacterized protein n=1 Tax=Rhodotorula pacifica TaxID=1495444 RepID=UPI0031734DE0